MDQQSSEIELRAAITQLSLLAVVEGIIGYLFYYFTTNPDYYGSEDCVYLRKYSYIFGLGILIFCVMRIFLFTFGGFSRKPELLAGVTTCCSCITILFYIMLWIALFIALGYNEECGQLRVLVNTMLIIMIIGILLQFCSCFCVMIAIFVAMEDEGN